MPRTLFLLYGAACYAAFLGTLVYAIGFVAGVLVPTTLDGPTRGSLAAALAVDLALLALFAVQHSGMARPRFKRWLTRVVPPPVERSTYVLASVVVLVGLFWLWRPIGASIWDVGDRGWSVWIWVAYGGGWALLVYVTFLIDHFELFGLRQVWSAWRGRTVEPPRFRTPTLYRWVRHPLYVAWLLIFWATPTMTAGHLVFSASTTLYILVAIRLEERDLVSVHGDSYERYRRQVPMLLPRLTPLRPTVGRIAADDR